MKEFSSICGSDDELAGMLTAIVHTGFVVSHDLKLLVLLEVVPFRRKQSLA